MPSAGRRHPGICFQVCGFIDCEVPPGVFSTLSPRLLSGFLLVSLLFWIFLCRCLPFPDFLRNLPCFGFNSSADMCGMVSHAQGSHTPLSHFQQPPLCCLWQEWLPGHATLSRLWWTWSSSRGSCGLLPACRNSPWVPAPWAPVCSRQSCSCWSVLLGPSCAVVGVSFTDLTHILCPSETCHDCCHPVLTCPPCNQQAAAGQVRSQLPMALCPLPGHPSVQASPS